MADDQPAIIDSQSVQVTVSSGQPPSCSKPKGKGLGCSPSPPIKTSSIHYDTTTATVVMPDLTTSASIVAAKPDPSDKPKDFIMFSCFVILCCNFIFGFLGYSYGLKSYDAWQLGEINQARKRALVALIFNVVGILFGVATWVLAFTLYFACEPCNPFSERHE